jgi:polar amino acid transport system substrate-binding protein
VNAAQRSGNSTSPRLADTADAHDDAHNGRYRRSPGHRRSVVTLRTAGRTASLVLTAAALVAGMAGCAKKDAATTAGGVKLVHKGKLTVCTHLPYAPFQAKDATGKVVGFDIDVIDLVAKKLGVQQDIVDTPFEGIKSGQDLKTGKCDLAAAAMSITPERQKAISFSDPYFDATQAMLVKTGKPYKSLADLKGKRLGAQSSTTGLDYVKQHAAGNGYEVVDYKDLGTEQQALVTGQIEAAVNDIPVWAEFIRQHQGAYAVAAEFDTGDKYGFGMRKDANPELVKTVNEVLAKARKDGTYDRIYEKWIGRKPGK